MREFLYLRLVYFHNMIEQFKIENYKSIPSLTLDLGRVNVLIGENGCGKTNVLEAMALGSAAEAGNMEDAFLAARGIRVADPRIMRSAFNQEASEKEIIIGYHIKGGEIQSLRFINNTNQPFAQWELNASQGHFQGIKEYKDQEKKPQFTLTEFKDFRIYAPESYFLRRFEDDTQNKPLGVRGEGLFKLLATTLKENPENLVEIQESLQLIDWFDDFEIPNDLVFNERRIRIRDRYLDEGIQYIDQRSSNEGFLYLLFYITLIISPYTPKLFAIDNIDTALNPKLCSKLISEITRLAKKHGKQIIVTAHNPGLLDGLNLNDDEQRLFVISRNKFGHTKALRIQQKPSNNGHEPVRLSEQFLRGYIGGIPTNF